MSDGLLARLTRGGGPSNAVGLLALLVALVLLFTLLLPGRFDNYGTVQSMMFQLPELGLLALAMVIPLISGGLNLAIIATTNQCALLMAWIMSTWMPAGAGGMEAAAIVAVALLAGSCCARRSACSPAFSSPPWASTRSW
ncbi:MAG: hypothetical protein U1E52_19595 [Geminicoccaceae bacterium]